MAILSQTLPTSLIISRGPIPRNINDGSTDVHIFRLWSQAAQSFSRKVVAIHISTMVDGSLVALNGPQLWETKI